MSSRSHAVSLATLGTLAVLAGCASPLTTPVAPAPEPEVVVRYQFGASARPVAQADARMALAESIAGAGTSASEPVQLVEGAPPAIPAQAIRENIQGTVGVKIGFNQDGTVSYVDVVSSPSDVLSAAVVEAVSRWRVSPRSRSLRIYQWFSFTNVSRSQASSQPPEITSPKP